MTHQLTLDWEDYRYEPTSGPYSVGITPCNGLYENVEDIMAEIRQNLPSYPVVRRTYIVTLLNQDGIATSEFKYSIMSPNHSLIRLLAEKVSLELYSMINNPPSDSSAQTGGFALDKDDRVIFWSSINNAKYSDDVILSVPVNVDDFGQTLKGFNLINERGRFHQVLRNDDQVCDHMGEFIDSYLIPRLRKDVQIYQQKELDWLDTQLTNWL